jgi:thiol-disulfide isomerase/thioredoxin
MNKQTLISIGIIVVVVVGALIFLQHASNKPGKLDTFAACLGEKGATFYGAFWCPHCAEQKAMFGTSVKFLPYKECSTPDSKGQTQVCIDAGIASYPTWQYADGTRANGVQTLQALAAKTGCTLPGDTPVNASTDVGGTSSAIPTSN